MGIGFGTGDTRAADAARDAVASPLLEQTISGAKGILLNVTGGKDLTLYEVNEAAQLVAESADKDAQIIFGTVIDVLGALAYEPQARPVAQERAAYALPPRNPMP